jgi:hypothetical protein
VTRYACFACFPLAFVFTFFTPTRSLAQTPAPDPATTASTAQPPAADDDDDARLRPLEPDFTIINLPSTLPLPLHAAGNFHLTHRFVGVNWRRDDFSTIATNLFGFDGPAIIQLEYRIAVMKHLEAVVARTNFDRTIQFSGKYDAFHEGTAGKPFGLSVLASVEAGNNFHPHNSNGLDIGYSPGFGVVLSRTLANAVAVYADPIWVHNTLPDGSVDKQNTFFVGLGARVRIVPSLFVVGEVSPRAGGYAQGDPEFAFSLEKRVGGHVFSLVVANTQATTFAQIARGGSPQTLYIGFNLARKFY